MAKTRVPERKSRDRKRAIRDSFAATCEWLRSRAPKFGMRRILKRAGVALLVALSLGVSGWAQNPPEDLSKLSVEDLMNMEVTSVSKKGQKVSQTAAAIFVITQEDIRRSGANNIPDLLRMVPGVNVAQITPDATIAPPEILRGIKVLVAHDNATNRRILEGVLKRWDMQTKSVESGDEALAELPAAGSAGEPYVLILTDMHMPGMDGFKLVERIRQMPELSTATVRMLTSSESRGKAERSKSLGVSAYLPKPIRLSELREAIARVVGAREHKSEIAPVTLYSAKDPQAAAETLRILLAEDNLVNQRLATRLLEKRGHRVVVASNGREALAALENGSYDLVLMDIQMPEMNGMEATARIREKE